MNPAIDTSERVYTVLFPFSGVGGAALGFQASGTHFRTLGVKGRFRVLGGIDSHPSTARDFERLTGAPCLCMDVRKVTPALLRQWFGDRCPDVIFFSPPCKGGSGLLPDELAKSPKYADMNALCMAWLELMFETWGEGPLLLLMENVPNLANRAKAMFKAVAALLRSKGYLMHSDAHDCGELGGLAQRRKRLLMVARHGQRVPALLYKPKKRRVRPVSEVLEHLPLPNDPAGGPMHRLPEIDVMTALRLALIPAGKDWKALPSRVLVPAEFAERLGRRKVLSERTPYNDVWRVSQYASASPCVTGGATPSAGCASVADPRAGYAHDARDDDHGVVSWCSSVGAVTGKTLPGNGRFAVADPRPLCAVNPRGTRAARCRNDDHGVLPWSCEAGTVTGETCPSNGRFSVADPRAGYAHAPRNDDHGVTGWSERASAITGNARPGTGRFSVADPRPMCTVDPQLRLGAGTYSNICVVMAWSSSSRAVVGASRPAGGALSAADPRVSVCSFHGSYGITPWGQSSGVVTGALSPSTGPLTVADPRPVASCHPHVYGVLGPGDTAHVITGNLTPGGGPFSYADARVTAKTAERPDEWGIAPLPAEVLNVSPEWLASLPFPFILSADGTWHRPFTSWECAALQNLPLYHDGKPLDLEGTKTQVRVKVGDAVPVMAATRIGDQCLYMLLDAELATWTPSEGGVWVRPSTFDTLDLAELQ